MNDLIVTEDGSLTCRDAVTGELCHNRAGAYTEALRNYCEPSEAPSILQSQGQMRVLDACFGLGYNSFVLVAQLLAAGVQGRLSVVGVETDPAILELIPKILEHKRFANLRNLFAAGADFPCRFGCFRFVAGQLEVELEIRRQDLRQFLRQALQTEFDLVFHDPFSPGKMPELWTLEVFERYYQLLAPRCGKLLTYSSAFAVRGGLKQAGFGVFRTQAVGGKSGGTLAATDPHFIGSQTVCVLSPAESGGLAGRSGVPYRDRGLVHSRQEIVIKRLQDQHHIEINRSA